MSGKCRPLCLALNVLKIPINLLFVVGYYTEQHPVLDVVEYLYGR